MIYDIKMIEKDSLLILVRTFLRWTIWADICGIIKYYNKGLPAITNVVL